MYVYDKLGEDHRFRGLALKDRRWKDLIQQIVDKAEGVFLWVYLVVQSLLNGLEDDNDIPDMQRRVDILPSDLEKCFKHMLGEIDEVYRSHTAQMFQMCLHAKGPLTAVTFSFLKLERSDPDYAIAAKAESPTRETLEVTKEKMKKYINARSRGLLEVNIDQNQSISMQYKVDFLHRPVKDFLKTKEAQDMLQSQEAPGFEVHTSLCRATLAQIKLLQPEECTTNAKTSLLVNQTKRLMSYAKRIELDHGRSESRILDELDRFHALHTNAAVPFARTVPEMQDWEDVVQDSLGARFIAWAIESELFLYVAEKLNAHPSLLQSLVEYTLQYGLYGRYMDMHPMLLKVLLYSEGEERTPSNSSKMTTWSRFLSSCRQIAANLVTK
ncbi:hypothetical protein EG329_005821 [Mollisiaceae sp. DMI_Dod_QoI]|nr:hypothetical protein EG329_005821 [Helotiales sp. DMI_Dod_QoI]